MNRPAPRSTDLPLTPASRAYQAVLGDGVTDAFAVTDLDVLGLPAWSVTHAPPGGPLMGGFGYGESDAEALTGAFGELLESVCSARAVPRLPVQRASWTQLRAAGHEAVHPWSLCPPAGSPVDGSTPLAWAPAHRAAGPDSGEEVWLPLDLVASSGSELPAGYRPYTTPITNGLGAHADLDRAVVHAVEELVQRDGNGVVFRALDQGRVLTFAPGEPGGPSAGILARFAAAGVEVLVKLASLDFGLTNVYVVSAGPGPADASPLLVTACGEAAERDPERALRKALLEHTSSRVRKVFTHGPLDAVEAIAPPGYLDRVRALVDPSTEEPRTLDGMVEWLGLDTATLARRLAPTVLSRRTEEAWDKVVAAGGDVGTDTTADRLTAAGLDVLVVDLSPHDRSFGAAKVVVPGLEVETMSYHRIGERNAARLLAQGHPMVGRGPAGHGTLPVRLLPEAEARLGGPVWFDPRVADSVIDGLYPLYREPGRHAAPLARAATA